MPSPGVPRVLSAGLSEDVSALVTRVKVLFDTHEELRFSHFQTVWNEMNFALIFCGRECFRELYEFVEELLDIVKQRCLPPESLPGKAAALYLLYAIYFKQPLSKKIRIRLTLSEYKDITGFVSTCRDNQHWDLVYVWAKLVKDQAFTYTATSTTLGLELATSQEIQNFIAEKSGKHNSELQSEEFQELFAKVGKLHTRYKDMKVALGQDGKLDPGLNLVSDNFSGYLVEKVDKMYEPVKDSDKADGSEIGNRRKMIREKAFRTAEMTTKEKKLEKGKKARKK